jgi:hypothetical protein
MTCVVTVIAALPAATLGGAADADATSNNALVNMTAMVLILSALL